MRTLTKISQQTFWQLFGKSITSLSTFIILAFVARVYGEEQTGVFTLALTYLAIFYIFSDFGFNGYLLAKFQRFTEDQKNIAWRKLFGTRLIWSLFLIFISLSLLPFLNFTNTFFLSIILGCLAIPAFSVFVTANLFFQAKLRYELSIAASSSGTIMTLVLSLIIAYFAYPVPLLLFGHFIGWFIIAVVSLFLIKKFLHQIVPIFDKNYIINLFRNAWPLAFTLVLNVIYFRADAFILSYYKSFADVGIYNVAYQVFQNVLVIPTFIMNSFYPIMLQSLNTKKFILQIKLAVTCLLFFSVFISVGIFILSQIIILIITGGGFEGARSSLQILSIGFPAYFISALLMWVAIAKKMFKQILWIYSLGLLFNIAANFIYIPQYSYIAASWVSVISEYLILLSQIIVLYRDR